MSKALITESYLTAIANAIRSKTNTTQTFTPAQMAGAIDAIPTGYTAKEVLEGTAAFLSGTYVDNETTELAAGIYAFNSKIQNVTFNSCTIIGNSAFYTCNNLTIASFLACTSIGSNAFYSCTGLTTISFPICTHIGSSAFYTCDDLTIASFPACTYISAAAFFSCINLTTISFPVCRTIYSKAFQNDYHLTTVFLPACTRIHDYAFYQCNGLTTISFPVCTRIDQYAFYYCYKLSEVSFPICNWIGSYAFQNGMSLTTISFPVCTFIGTSTFAGCNNLTTARFDVSSTNTLTINPSAFYRCYNLLSLYILGERLAVLSNINAFTSTPISTYTGSTGGVHGSIFVRASLLTAYQSASRWSTYSSRFVGLTDEQIAALDT